MNFGFTLWPRILVCQSKKFFIIGHQNLEFLELRSKILNKVIKGSQVVSKIMKRVHMKIVSLCILQSSTLKYLIDKSNTILKFE